VFAGRHFTSVTVNRFIILEHVAGFPAVVTQTSGPEAIKPNTLSCPGFAVFRCAVSWRAREA